MLVRLTKKLANVLNGIDLTHCNEGDVIDVPERYAHLLTAERWAESVDQDEVDDCGPVRAVAPAEMAVGVEVNDVTDASVAEKLRAYRNAASPK
jgi:hypothetical protein